MRRRMNLASQEPAKEEDKPCSLYNNFRNTIPSCIWDKAPPRLKTGDTVDCIKQRDPLAKGAMYPENCGLS